MNSLTIRLACVFIAISLIPLVIGITGIFALQTADSALNENNRALQNLSQLLASADQSLTGNVHLQNRADSLITDIVQGQQQASAALQEMADVMLPRSFAVSRLRLALAEINQAERALLLAVNMRHLVGGELRAAQEMQLENIRLASESMEEAKAHYLALSRSDEDKVAWEAFEQSLVRWQDNHNLFIIKLGELNLLVEDLIRGGPLFVRASREAYDILFLAGRAVRQECEQRIADLNTDIVTSADMAVRRAVETQSDTAMQVEGLSHDYGAAFYASNQLQASFDEARSAADVASESSADAVASTRLRFWYMALFSAIGVIGAMVAGLIITWRISRPVRNIITHMSRLARGDLTIDVPSADQGRTDEIGQLARALQNVIDANRAEIRLANAMADGDYTHSMPLRSDHDQLGRALTSMMLHTNDALAKVSQAIDRVGNGAAAVSEASRSLSLGAQTSASAVEEISQTVHHVDKQAQDNTDKSQEASKLAMDSRDAAQRGYSAVTELVSSMNEIQQSGGKIATVAKLIDDIAFQTNLLALNAAVEAARAGRQGRGFSVVADEVRNLAGRSAKAARETSAMIHAMNERMQAGVQLAARSDQEFREIVEATEKVASIFADINESSKAQSLAMAQIAQGLSQIDLVIQENTSSAGSTASSSLALSRQADELRRMVGRFRLLSVRMDKNGNAVVRSESGAAVEELPMPSLQSAVRDDMRLLDAPGEEPE
jgi:Methyl-accepting chemotaxis protein